MFFVSHLGVMLAAALESFPPGTFVLTPIALPTLRMLHSFLPVHILFLAEHPLRTRTCESKTNRHDSMLLTSATVCHGLVCSPAPLPICHVGFLMIHLRARQSFAFDPSSCQCLQQRRVTVTRPSKFTAVFAFESIDNMLETPGRLRCAQRHVKTRAISVMNPPCVDPCK